MTTPTVDLRNTGSVFDRARGWVVSTLVHGLGITGSLFVMGAIEQPPPPHCSNGTLPWLNRRHRRKLSRLSRLCNQLPHGQTESAPSADQASRNRTADIADASGHTGFSGNDPGGEGCGDECRAGHGVCHRGINSE